MWGDRLCCIRGLSVVLLVFGPAYPNFAGFCLALAAMAIFVSMTNPDVAAPECVCIGLLLMGELLCLALCHSNAVFTCVLLLSPYCAYRFFDEAAKRTNKRVARLAAPLAFILFILFLVILL